MNSSSSGLDGSPLVLCAFLDKAGTYTNTRPASVRLQVKVKMVTADNEETVDIIIEGDIEEITRFAKV
jgi:hypothetical protein